MNRAKAIRGLIPALLVGLLAYGATYQGPLWGLGVIGVGLVLGVALLRRSSLWPSPATKLGMPIPTEWPLGLLLGAALASALLGPSWSVQFRNDQVAESVAKRLCAAELSSDHSIRSCGFSVGEFAGDPADWPSTSVDGCSVTFSVVVKPAFKPPRDQLDLAQLQFAPVMKEIREDIPEPFFFGGKIISGKTLTGESFSQVWFGSELSKGADPRC